MLESSSPTNAEKILCTTITTTTHFTYIAFRGTLALADTGIVRLEHSGGMKRRDRCCAATGKARSKRNGAAPFWQV